MRKWKQMIIFVVIIIFTGCGKSAQDSSENHSNKMEAEEVIERATVKGLGDIFKSYFDIWKNYFCNFPDIWPLENYYGGVS